MSSSRWVYIDVEAIVRESADAFLVKLQEDNGEHDAGDELWLPKSQVVDAGDYQAGDNNVELGITEWLAGEKGLE